MTRRHVDRTLRNLELHADLRLFLASKRAARYFYVLSQKSNGLLACRQIEDNLPVIRVESIFMIFEMDVTNGSFI